MKDNNQTVPDASAEIAAEGKENGELEVAVKDDIAMLNGIAEKYSLTVLEKKVISKIVSLLETKQMRNLLPPQKTSLSPLEMQTPIAICNLRAIVSLAVC